MRLTKAATEMERKREWERKTDMGRGGRTTDRQTETESNGGREMECR